MLMNYRTLLFRFLLLVGSASTLYFLVPFKLAEIRTQAAIKQPSPENQYQEILALNPHSDKVLTNLAEMMSNEGQHQKAREYALKALSHNPTNGRAMTMLIPIFDQLKKPKLRDQAVTLSPKLWTAHSYVHSTLADYWAKQGDIVKVLAEWDLLMTRHPGLTRHIFPVLLTYANTKQARHLLAPYASKPSPWWKSFFTYMVREKSSLTVLQHFYALRTQANTPLEKYERVAYVQRLQQEKFWSLAYSAWISGLSNKEFTLIDSLYDGSFESKRHNTGFDWYFQQSKQAKISLGRTRGIKGKKALHIVFNKRKSIRFNHVRQRLLLAPGLQYKVSMQSRIDALKNPVGLIWRVSCADDKKTKLGSSEPLTGRKKWHEVSFEFKVPEQGCKSQMLHLQAASKYHHEHFFSGSVWFDQINITPIVQLSKK